MRKIGVLGAALISFGAGLYLGADRKDDYGGVKSYLVRNPESSDDLIYDSIRVALRNEISFSDRTRKAMAEVLADSEELRNKEKTGLIWELEGEAEEFLKSLKSTDAYEAFRRFEERMEDIVK